MSIEEAFAQLARDPFIVTVVGGIIWPWVQAMLDRPWWTPSRRVALVILASVVMSIVVWFVGAYPLQWRLIVAQISAFLGTAWVVYQVLAAVRINGVSLLDWVGVLTPGGATVPPPRHAKPEDGGSGD